MIPRNRDIDKPFLRRYHDVMKPAKAMTIRLSAEQAEALETVANIEDRPIAEVIRAAIAEHIDSRKKDPSFQQGLKERIERERRLLSE